ncbi:hypothetical protein BH11PSE5_BH11PSE5_27020 [soil metagenome]
MIMLVVGWSETVRESYDAGAEPLNTYKGAGD